MSVPDSPAARAARYRNVLAQAARHDEFTLESLKLCLREEQPSFVTRAVHALARDGLLVLNTASPDPSYRWALDRDAGVIEAWIEGKVNTAQIKSGPAADRPRERLLAHGAAALRTAELLAILVRSGRPGESALQAGEKVANRYADCLEKLTQAGRGELKAISSAVQTTAYCQIMAGMELGRRVGEAADQHGRQRTKIRSTDDAIEFCRERFGRLAADARQEELHVVTLDTGLQVIGTHCITKGLLDSNTLHPREVFRPAIQDAAKAIIVVHNHPSGTPEPSAKDLSVTERLEQAAATVDIQLLDHIIVATGGTTSIQEHRTANL